MKALIAMSGGVDSSVAAYMMKKNNFECEGVTMRLYENEDLGCSRFHTCCSSKDIEDASEVAFNLDMPYEVIDYTADFRKNIIDKFIKVYENGGTPNPCLDCNRYMKFEKLLEEARKRGAEYIVTGHYARIKKNENTGRYLLKKALDDTKDQSYVLYMLTQDQLKHICFPLGSMKKTEVREIALEKGFVNARKHDSQDICFVPDGDYSAFISQYTGKKYPCGDFILSDGTKLGEHKGIISYTVGQRKGLGIAYKKPLYVKEINPVENKVVLGDNEELFRKTVILKDINLISVPKIEVPMHCNAKIRYRQTEQPATVTQIDDNTLKVTFDMPQRAATVGQAGVLYDGDVVIGGGTIMEVRDE